MLLKLNMAASTEWPRIFMKKIKLFTTFLDGWRAFCNTEDNRCLLVFYSKLLRNTRDTMKSVLQYLDIPQTRLDCLQYSSIIEGSFHRKKSKISTNENDSPFCHLSTQVQKEGRSILERYVNTELQTSSYDFDVLLAEAIRNEIAQDTKINTCSKFLFEPI